MGYHNWFHKYFREQHKTNQAILDEIFHMLELRGNEYLAYNNEHYKELYINPNDKILTSKPQIIQQVKEELYDFLLLLMKYNVKRVLQIGLGHFGSTQFCLSLICDKVVTVEYDKKNISNYVDRELLYNQNIETFVYGNSINDEVIEKTKKIYGINTDASFDCLFIDGNHSYEYVKKDHKNYSRMVKMGGIVAFHDAFLDGDRYGTPKVLSEISKKIKYIKHSNEVGIAYYIK